MHFNLFPIVFPQVEKPYLQALKPFLKRSVGSSNSGSGILPKEGKLSNALDKYNNKTSNVFAGYSHEKAQAAEAERLQKLQQAEMMQVDDPLKKIVDSKICEISGRKSSGKSGKGKKSGAKKTNTLTLSPKRSFSITLSPKKSVSFSPEKTVKVVDTNDNEKAEASAAKCDLTDFFNSLSELEVTNDDEKVSELAAIKSELEAGLSSVCGTNEAESDITQSTPSMQLNREKTAGSRSQTGPIVDMGNEMKHRKRKLDDGSVGAVFNNLIEGAKKLKERDFNGVFVKYKREEGLMCKKGPRKASREKQPPKQDIGKGSGRRATTPPFMKPGQPRLAPKIPVQYEATNPESSRQPKVMMKCKTVEVGKNMSVTELSPKQRQTLAAVLAQKGLSLNPSVMVRFERHPTDGSTIMKVVCSSPRNSPPLKKGVKFSPYIHHDDENKKDNVIDSGQSGDILESKRGKMVYVKDPSGIQAVKAQPTPILKSATPASPPKSSGESATIVPQYGTPGRTNTLSRDSKRVFVSPILAHRRPTASAFQRPGNFIDTTARNRFSPMRPMSPGYKTVDTNALRGLLDPGSPYVGMSHAVQPDVPGVGQLSHSRSVPEVRRVPSSMLMHETQGSPNPQHRSPTIPIPSHSNPNVPMSMHGIAGPSTSLQSIPRLSSPVHSRSMFPISMQGTPGMLMHTLPHIQGHPQMPSVPQMSGPSPLPSTTPRHPPASAICAGHFMGNVSSFQHHIQSPMHPLSVQNMSHSTQQSVPVTSEALFSSPKNVPTQMPPNTTPPTVAQVDKPAMIAQPSVRQASSPAFMPRQSSHMQSPITSTPKAVLADEQPTDLSLSAPLTQALDLTIPSPRKEANQLVQALDNVASQSSVKTSSDSTHSKEVKNDSEAMKDQAQAGKSDEMLEKYLAL